MADQYASYFFEDDDEWIRELACQYREGDLLSGELKGLAAEWIADFLAARQQRGPSLDR